MIQIKTYVGERIKSLRIAKNLTQAELGEEVNLPQSYIAAIERGLRNISLDTLHKLMIALSITPSELFRSYDNNTMNKENYEAIDRINHLLFI